MATLEKCAHEACSCLVPEDGEFDEYCSAHCRDAEDLSEIKCECGHPGCIAEHAGHTRSKDQLPR